MISGGEPDRGRIGIFTTDTDLVVRSWDATLAEMTGIAADRAVGQPIEALEPSLRERGMLDLLREPLVSGSPVVLAAALHKYLIPCVPLDPSAEFDRMQQRVVIGALRNEEAAVGVVVTVEDVTARLERERRLARELKQADPAARLAAVKQLEADDPAAAEHLTGAITDEDWRVRRAAVTALGQTQDAALVSGIVAALREGHRNFSLLSSALQLLTLTGVDLTGALAGLLRDPDVGLRIQAALALGTQRTEGAAAALMSALDDPDANVQFHVIEALGKLGARSAVSRLAAIATSADFFLAFAAIDALLRIGDPAGAELLTPLLSNPMLAGAVAEALGRIGDDNVIEPLLAALEAGNAPVDAVVSAIVALRRRCDATAPDAASDVEARVASGLSAGGAERVLHAMSHAHGQALRDLVVVGGWLRNHNVPPALARMLGSPDVRPEVIEALVRFGASSVDLLTDQLGNDDADTRRAAAIALGRIGDRRAVPGLIPLLQDDPADVRLAAIAALAGIGDGTAFRPLLALVGDADAGVRQAAIGALNSIGHPDMERQIAVLLESEDARTRESAVKIAGYFGYPSCAQIFLARCKDADEGVRCAALEHLPYFDEPGGLDILTGTIKDDTPRARAAAVHALGVIAGPRARSLTEGALADPDAWVRYFAAISLGRHSDPAGLPGLTRLANSDSSHFVRVAAVEALAAIGGEGAVSALQPLVSDPDPDVAQTALRALGRLHWDGATALLTEALRSQDPGARLAAVEALAGLDDAVVVDQLGWTAAADEAPAVSDAAIAALVSISNGGVASSSRAVDALVALTADVRHREDGVAALARLKPAAIPGIARGLKVEDPRIRTAVVDALARMLHPAATACLQGALDDEDEGVRRQAVSRLARIGTRAAAGRLAALAERDPSALVRHAAAAAILRDAKGGPGRTGDV